MALPPLGAQEPRSAGRSAASTRARTRRAGTATTRASMQTAVPASRATRRRAVDVRVRFLHVVGARRSMRRRRARSTSSSSTASATCVGGGGRARGRLPPVPIGELAAGATCRSRSPPARGGGRARRAGALVRTWDALRGTVERRRRAARPAACCASPCGSTNTTPWPAAGRARRRCGARSARPTPCCGRAGGAFVSLTDPPRDAARGGARPAATTAPGRCSSASRASATRCCRRRSSSRTTREIAPESPGDLFDGGEIDQLLTLSILSLTDEEKAEMRASDPRAREILERTEALVARGADAPARHHPRVQVRADERSRLGRSSSGRAPRR